MHYLVGGRGAGVLACLHVHACVCVHLTSCQCSANSPCQGTSRGTSEACFSLQAPCSPELCQLVSAVSWAAPVQQRKLDTGGGTQSRSAGQHATSGSRRRTGSGQALQRRSGSAWFDAQRKQTRYSPKYAHWLAWGRCHSACLPGVALPEHGWEFLNFKKNKRKSWMLKEFWLDHSIPFHKLILLTVLPLQHPITKSCTRIKEWNNARPSHVWTHRGTRDRFAPWQYRLLYVATQPP